MPDPLRIEIDAAALLDMLAWPILCRTGISLAGRHLRATGSLVIEEVADDDQSQPDRDFETSASIARRRAAGTQQALAARGMWGPNPTLDAVKGDTCACGKWPSGECDGRCGER